MRNPFESHTCSAPAQRSERMRDIVLDHAPRDRALQVLDIGCGTGSLAFRLADALSLASVVGIDISAANIEAAEAGRTSTDQAGRLRFICADYLAYSTEPVDIVVTDTVLHFIRGRPVDLWAKLARETRRGGFLVACMAYDCAHNRAVAASRRFLRGVRSRAVDALLMAAGRRAYGRQFGDELIRERVEYMFIPPEQLMTRQLVLELAPSLGLRLVAHHEMPGTSATQLRQRVTVFQKDR